MINAVGASVICLSPYSPDFNPIELWWSQLKSFLRMFAPTTTSMIDRIIAVALEGVKRDRKNLQHHHRHRRRNHQRRIKQMTHRIIMPVGH
jgi:transposase